MRPPVGHLFAACLRCLAAHLVLVCSLIAGLQQAAAQSVPAGEPALAGAPDVDEVPPVQEELRLAEPSGEEQPLSRAEIEMLIEAEVQRRLGGIPRPRYIAATDVVPPQGILLLDTQPKRGEFPFAMALGGFMQLRWFEFARSKNEWVDAAGVTRPINNINTFNINRFLLSLNGHVADERLFYNFALFGTTNVGIRSGVVPIGLAGWKFSDAASLGAGM